MTDSPDGPARAGLTADDAWGLSCHEIGHAAMARWLGRPLRGVYIGRAVRGAAGQLIPAAADRPPSTPSPMPCDSPQVRAADREQLLLLVAGPVFERILARRYRRPKGPPRTVGRRRLKRLGIVDDPGRRPHPFETDGGGIALILAEEAQRSGTLTPAHIQAIHRGMPDPEILDDRTRAMLDHAVDACLLLARCHGRPLAKIAADLYQAGLLVDIEKRLSHAGIAPAPGSGPAPGPET